MSLSNLFISLDIGGTKTRGIAVNWPKGPCFKLQVPSKNLRLMVDLELGQLLFSIKNLLPEDVARQPATWLIGGAGARPDTDQKRVSHLFKDLGLAVEACEIYPDFEGNWAAAFGGNDGILSVNGTGSVIFGRWGNRETRRGGWGYLLDDTPCGATFGKWICQELLMEMETPGHPTPIFEACSKEFPQLPKTRQGLLELIYSSSAPQKLLGSFSKIMNETLNAGNQALKQKFDRSLDLWAEQLGDLARELELPDPVPMCGIGGLWTHWPVFSEKAMAAIQRKFPGKFTFGFPRFPTEWGPLIRFFNRNPGEPASWKNSLEILSQELSPAFS